MHGKLLGKAHISPSDVYMDIFEADVKVFHIMCSILEIRQTWGDVYARRL